MAFTLVIIGVILLTASVKGTQSQLAALVKGDFTGPNNFVYWLVAILLIGAVGYVPKLKPFSVAFLALVIVVLFLKRGNPSGAGGGFFNQFSQALGTTQSPANQPVSAVIPLGSSSPFGLPNLSTILPHL